VVTEVVRTLSQTKSHLTSTPEPSLIARIMQYGSCYSQTHYRREWLLRPLSLEIKMRAMHDQSAGEPRSSVLSMFCNTSLVLRRQCDHDGRSVEYPAPLFIQKVPKYDARPRTFLIIICHRHARNNPREKKSRRTGIVLKTVLLLSRRLWRGQGTR
jgi:hypothetical protein